MNHCNRFILPARELFNQVNRLQSIFPEGIYLNEALFISVLAEISFNNLDYQIDDIIKSTFDIEKYADHNDVIFCKDVIVENISEYTDLLQSAYRNMWSTIPNFIFVTIEGVSFITKSIHLKTT